MGQRGFTLVELLIALAIFAVLGLASWQVLHQVIVTKDRLAEQAEQFHQLQRTIWLVTEDLRSIVDRPVRDNQGTPEPAVSSVIPGYALVFTRNGWSSPQIQGRSDLRRIGYGIEEGDSGTRLIRYVWPVLDRASNTEPARQVLLDSVDRLEIHFIDHRGQTAFYWPPASGEDEGGFRPPVPSGIRVRLSHPAWGEIERIVQLREVTLW